VQGELKPSTVRCRVRHEAIVIELDVESIRVLDRPKANVLQQEIGAMMSTVGLSHPVSFQPYRMGSAFLRPDHER
jgi:uncharacterized protein